MRPRLGRLASAVPLAELGSPQAAGQLSAVLFFLCGLLVAVTSPLMPAGPHVHPLVLAGIGLTAAASGVVIMALPWRRWPRSATLWLIPLAFALIGLHNWATGANGLRYVAFFLVVAAWIGLMHPRGTAMASTPGMVLAYLAPAWWLGDRADIAASLTYAVPVFILIGESASLVAERLRASQDDLRRSEQRFRALVQHGFDVISVVGADAVILWDSPGVEGVLGYAADERVGSPGLDYVHPDYVDIARAALARLIDEPGSTIHLELQVRHRDGSWRWAEVKVRNLLDEPAVGGLVVNLSDVTERHRGQEVQQQLAAIVESTADAVIGQRLDGTVTSWNSAAERMYGRSAREMIGNDIRTLVPADRLGELDDLLARVAAGEQLTNVATTRVRRDGETIHIALSMSPVRDAAGEVVAAAAIARDISADVRAAEALKNTAASFQLLFSANPQPMWVYDLETLRFLEVNDAAVHHYGYSRERFLRMAITDIRPAEDVERLLSDLALDREVSSSDGWRHQLADGRLIDVEITSHRLQFANRNAVLVAVRDVTDRLALENQLRHQAFHDSLTGLSNRALFGDRVEHALGRRTTTSTPVVLLLDLDRFKVINDSMGHAAGDELLVAVANRLQAAVRSGDTVSRLGGDEFAVLLDECDPALAEGQAARLLDALAAPVYVGSKRVVVTGSVGIAAATDLGVTSGELLRNADMAMYRAKAAGGGCWRMFEPAMHADALRRMELAAALREGMDGDHFVLHYQPVVGTADGRVVGMEALVRWRHDGNLVPPSEFIPVLEESGLIVQLGEWVLQRACADAASWPDRRLRVNVNLSGRQLAEPDVVRHVREALDCSGLPPERLMLEITESVLVHDIDASIRRLTQLRALGVGLAIDDFGTGYSSLSYLRTFAVDELKIDKAFIDPIESDPAAVQLVETIVGLARSLNLETVAEGVETREQYELLRGLGCSQVQGFYVARPAPVEEAVAVSRRPARWHRPADALPDQRTNSAASRS